MIIGKNVAVPTWHVLGAYNIIPLLLPEQHYTTKILRSYRADYTMLRVKREKKNAMVKAMFLSTLEGHNRFLKKRCFKSLNYFVASLYLFILYTRYEKYILASAE